MTHRAPRDLATIAPGGTIGILGGGQLGRMLAMAAARLGYRTIILAPDDDAVAADVAGDHVRKRYDDASALADFAARCDVVTYEWENIPDAALVAVGDKARGASALAVARDRLVEKAFASDLGLATPVFAPVDDRAMLADAVRRAAGPTILKTRTLGYDGKGQTRLATDADAAALDAAWRAIAGAPAILEAQVSFDAEFSVILARRADGAVAVWDSAVNVHDAGILARSVVPAPAALAAHIAEARARTIALADALDHVGVLSVEWFAAATGPVFNEIAPRVHNSGHWSIEGAVTSQFENHIRAICGLPLGSTALVARPVVMDNLIGTAADDWACLLADPDCHLHLYGKSDARPGRKMGHATYVGAAAARRLGT